MSDTPLQFTLREMRATFTRPRTWLVIGVAALILGLAGPFGTYELPVGARLAYWAATATLTFIAGDFTITLISAALWRRMNKWLLVPLTALAGAVPVTLVVLGVNLVAFGPAMATIDPLPLFAYCVAITAGVTLLIHVFLPRGPGGEVLRAGGDAPAADPGLPPLLERLPLHKRGALISLTVEDHYVRVQTEKGAELVLMRLSDAIRETAGVAGLQIHRSHWVALAGVQNTERRNGKWIVLTSKGDALPVSRSFVPAAREQGLIR